MYQETGYHDSGYQHAGYQAATPQDGGYQNVTHQDGGYQNVTPQDGGYHQHAVHQGVGYQQAPHQDGGYQPAANHGTGHEKAGYHDDAPEVAPPSLPEPYDGYNHLPEVVPPPSARPHNATPYGVPYGVPQAGAPETKYAAASPAPVAAPVSEPSPPPAPASLQDGTKNAQTRRTRMWLLGGVVALLIVVIAVVAGVLGSRLANNNNNNNSASPAAATTATASASSSDSSSASSTSRSSGPLGPSASPTFSSVTSFASHVTYASTTYPVEQNPPLATLVAGGTETYVDCPYSNNTVYVDEATGTKFLRQCGLNGLGADLTNSVAYSLSDCMARCANRNTYDPGACAAVVWIWAWDGGPHVPGQYSKFNYCYLKGSGYNETVVWNWMSVVALIIP